MIDKSVPFTAAQKREMYRRLCRDEYIPLHSQAWYLDAVCGENRWEAALVTDKNGRITGALPYVLRKKFGILTEIRNPLLSIYNFLYLRLPDNPDISKIKLLSKSHKIIGQLAEQLPEVTFFRQNLHPDLQNILPFLRAGYRQTTRYSYVFNDLSDPEVLLQKAAYNLRHDIKKTESLIEIETSDNPEPLYSLNVQSYAEKGLPLPYSRAFLLRAYEALQIRKNKDLYYAKDKSSGEIVAGLLIAYDEKTAYALTAGYQRNSVGRSPLNCLYRHAVIKAAKRVQRFDFEGSMTPEIEHIYRNFGAKRTPYHHIYRFRSRLWHAVSVLGGKI